MHAALRSLPLVCAILLPLQVLGSKELDPLIAPHAARHRAEIDKILVKAESAERLARDAYLVQLDRVEADLIAKGDANSAAAIVAERKGAAGITGATPENGNLPKKAQGPRRTLIKELAKIHESAIAAARRPNSVYTAALNAIPGTAENTELAKQIVTEKKRLLLGVGIVMDLQTDLAGTLWRRVDNNKVLHVFTLDKKWEGSGWAAQGPNRVRFDWGTVLILADEGNMLVGDDGKPNMTLERARPSKVEE